MSKVKLTTAVDRENVEWLIEQGGPRGTGFIIDKLNHQGVALQCHAAEPGGSGG